MTTEQPGARLTVEGLRQNLAAVRGVNAATYRYNATALAALHWAEVATAALEAAEARAREYESAICWDTTCTSCAATLTALRAQEERAEKAEAELARLRASLGEPVEVWGNLDDQGVFRSARDRQEADVCTARYDGRHGMRTARRLVYTTAPEVVEPEEVRP